MLITKEEANLINLIRIKYRFGDIIINIHDGSPKRIKKVEFFDDLKGELQISNPCYNWELIKQLNDI
jgi:hypothetical protein